MKPFGDGMSQEKMLQVAALITLQLIAMQLIAMADCAALQEGTMLRASSGGLTFPPNPKVPLSLLAIDSSSKPDSVARRSRKRLRILSSAAWPASISGPTCSPCALQRFLAFVWKRHIPS
jgi:hypothetical protein